MLGTNRSSRLNLGECCPRLRSSGTSAIKPDLLAVQPFDSTCTEALSAHVMNRTAMRAIGLVVVVASFGFLANQVTSQIDDLAEYDVPFEFYLTLCVASAVYGSLLLTNVAALSSILHGLGNRTADLFAVCDVVGHANVAKYLPGNVFHYVGRQVLARHYGWEQWSVAVASVLESIIVTTASLFLVLLTSLASSPELSSVTGKPIRVVAAVLCLFVAGTFVGLRIQRLRALVSKVIDLNATFDFLMSWRTVTPLCFYVVFFLASGLLLVALTAALEQNSTYEIIPSVLACYIGSWFLGYVTPSAPGGIGIREAALVYGLSPLVGEPAALLLAIAVRVMTTSGDIILYLLAMGSRRFAAGQRGASC